MTSCSSTRTEPNRTRVGKLKKKKKKSSCQQNRKSVLLCKKNRLALDLSSSNCSYFHATFMRLLFLSATHTQIDTDTQAPLPFSCCCCCCCCSRRCHCRCPCAYCATMHNALGFLSAFLCLKLSATLTLCSLWQWEWQWQCEWEREREHIPLLKRYERLNSALAYTRP